MEYETMNNEQDASLVQRFGHCYPADAPVWWEGKWWPFAEVPEAFFLTNPLSLGEALVVENQEVRVAELHGDLYTAQQIAVGLLKSGRAKPATIFQKLP
jgi:hypothetical protein